MSGWLAVRSEEGRARGGAAWDALDASLEGLERAEWSSGDGRLAAIAWRRSSRGYRHSGTLWGRGDSPVRVAWVGVCLEDEGESTEEALRALARERGAAGDPARWNGEFAAAALDERDGSLEVWTSRQAHCPVYTWHSGGLFVASTDLLRLVAFLPRAVPDRRAMDLFLRCGELIDGITHVEGVEFVPGGTRLRATGARPPERTRYWRFRHGSAPQLDLDTAVTECAARLRGAMRRIEKAYPRIGVPLSGGLDSRLLLGLCARPETVPSITWGTPRCRDLRYAADFARRVGSLHEEVPLDPAAHVPLWESGVAATAASVPIQSMVVLPFVERLAARADVMVDGLAGDAILGGNFLMRSWFDAASLEGLASATWRWRVRPDEDQRVDGLIRDAGVRGEGRAAWERSIRSMGDGPPLDRLVDWLLENRVFRNAKGGSHIFRARMEVVAPFFDRDLVDVLVRVPLSFRYKHRMYLAVLRRAVPVAARVRWQRTALPPGWGWRANLVSMAAHRALTAALKPLGVDPFPRRSFAAPDVWFRGPWASATRDVLLSERTLDRGLFAPDAVRALLGEHRDGKDRSSTIGNLLALELFYRRLDR
jgi:asparagine synthetase B (glutamine-hydrolysing)